MKGSPEQIAYNKAYYASHRAEKSDYYREHKEERDAYDAAYQASHKAERCAYYATYYQGNREAILAQSVAYRAEHGYAIAEKQRQKQAEFTDWLQILRANNGCEDCETHEGLLDHHHVDPETKKYQVSDMCNYSLDALEDELEKCVVLCRACHAKRHVAMRLTAAAS